MQISLEPGAAECLLVTNLATSFLLFCAALVCGFLAGFFVLPASGDPLQFWRAATVSSIHRLLLAATALAVQEGSPMTH